MHLGISVPSFRRKDHMLKLAHDFKELFYTLKAYNVVTELSLFIYDQGYDEEFKEQLPETEDGFNVFSAFKSEYPKGTSIGTIMRDSVMFFKQEYQDLEVDYLLMIDDDVTINPDREIVNTVANLLKVFDDYDLISGAKRLTKNISVTKFPDASSKINMIPYKARFIGINLHHVELEELLSSDMEQYYLGEDTYLFVKALCLKHTVGIVKGAGFIEIDHEMDGGLMAMAKEDPKYGNSTSWLRKYEIVRPKGASQDLLSDFFHYDSAHKLGLRGRNDILEYIESNIKIDPLTHNLVRLAGIQDMQDDGTSRKMFSKS